MNSKYILQKTSIFFLIFPAALLIAACTEKKSEPGKTLDDHLVEVTAMHDQEKNLHLFELSRHEISSGWTSFQFRNASPSDHFFMIYRVPEVAIEAAETANEPLLDLWFRGITEPFQEEYNPYIRGDIAYGEFANNLGAAIMENASWFFDPGAAPNGGPGFTAAGRVSSTTVYLEPGEYVVECYVKDEDEQFHSYLGMLEHLKVTETESGSNKPVATASLRISSENGIELDKELRADDHIIEIYFEDQATYAHMLGHNVQLVKLSDNKDEDLIDRLAGWMDWTQKGSLVNRAPEGAEFMGGVMEMTEGSTAFFNVSLEPGEYAWIAEVPDPAAHNMMKTFTVTD